MAASSLARMIEYSVFACPPFVYNVYNNGMLSMNTGIVRPHLIMVLIALLSGCAARDGILHSNQSASLDCCTRQQATEKQRAIAETASRLVGATTIQTGRRFITYDCAGVTRAVYLSQGTDLYEGSERSSQANGVGLIYEHVRKYGRIHRGPQVRPGDLVFFDNTWDFNGDGILNDPLTHVGVVENVEENGTVVFISRVSNAIERYRMNLRRPNAVRGSDGRLLNDYMRRKQPGDPPATGYLTGQLFAGFGRLND